MAASPSLGWPSPPRMRRRNLGAVAVPQTSTPIAPPSRKSDRDWAMVVAWFLALNVLDLGVTLHLVGRGAIEMNPLMAALLERGWEWAAVFKVATTAGVALGLWLGRRHLLVRRTGSAFLLLLAAITVYQVVDVWAAA